MLRCRLVTTGQLLMHGKDVFHWEVMSEEEASREGTSDRVIGLLFTRISAVGVWRTKHSRGVTFWRLKRRGKAGLTGKDSQCLSVMS